MLKDFSHLGFDMDLLQLGKHVAERPAHPPWEPWGQRGRNDAEMGGFLGGKFL